MHTEYRPDEAGVGFAVKLEKGPFAVARHCKCERKSPIQPRAGDCAACN